MSNELVALSEEREGTDLRIVFQYWLCLARYYKKGMN